MKSFSFFRIICYLLGCSAEVTRGSLRMEEDLGKKLLKVHRNFWCIKIQKFKKPIFYFSHRKSLKKLMKDEKCFKRDLRPLSSYCGFIE